MAELREELETRGLDSKGVKNSLIQRLQEAIDKEKNSEETSAEKPPETVEKMDTDEALETVIIIIVYKSQCLGKTRSVRC